MKDLIEKYAADGYEGKYLMCAVFKAAMMMAFFNGQARQSEYFYSRLEQLELELEIAQRK